MDLVITICPQCSRLTFVFLRLALRGSWFLLQGLSLGILSPPAQLEVDEFPHHKGLSDADRSQHSDPIRERGEQSARLETHSQRRREVGYASTQLTKIYHDI